MKKCTKGQLERLFGRLEIDKAQLAYRNAKQRCTNVNHVAYKDYGERGIEFRFTSFEQFIRDIGPIPLPLSAHSLERIDNEGHYEPGNVRWATTIEQRSNQRRNQHRRTSMLNFE